MTREQWRDWLEGIGIVALIASLIFVGIQLQQDKEIAVSQIYAEINNIEIERTRLILDNDDLWIRGLKGEELDERETLRFEALAEAWADLSNGRYIRVGRITFGSQDDVECQPFGPAGAKSSKLNHLSRSRVRAVGTVQILPRLPNRRMADPPRGWPFFLLRFKFVGLVHL